MVLDFSQPPKPPRKVSLELTERELHDLYDMLYMMDAGTIKINGCQGSWNSIFEKIEPIAVPELYNKEDKE